MPYLLLIFASIFWGGNYVVGHIVVNTINPYFLSLIRWGLTTVLMFTIYAGIIKKEWPLLVEHLCMNSIYALLGQVMFPLTLYIGLQYTSSLNAAIYISSTPCLVLFINRIFFKESISYRNILGVMVSTVGVLYLAFFNVHSGSQNALSQFGWGDIMTIISALSWAGYCSLLRLKDKRLTNTAFVSFCSLIGTIILIPIYLIYLFYAAAPAIFVASPSWAAFLGVAYLVIFPSYLSYVFWSKGVGSLGTTRSEIFTHGIPLSGGLLGIIFLGEKLHSYHIVALILIVFGIVCCSTYQSKANINRQNQHSHHSN
ncbi:DMT family transporter [Celerinatantimonas yamalensis]|uniref:DMT family transporter n=1 Tax=Celerinatantimonas yamalensis TaxID=559956 RepID=A0ABW9GA75_9GAMM